MDSWSRYYGHLLCPQLWLCGASPMAAGWNVILLEFFKDFWKVFMKLDDEDSGNGLDILPGTYGMDVPSACTIVIIAGEKRP